MAEGPIKYMAKRYIEKETRRWSISSDVIRMLLKGVLDEGLRAEASAMPLARAALGVALPVVTSKSDGLKVANFA
jgi:hypothetical protein